MRYFEDKDDHDLIMIYKHIMLNVFHQHKSQIGSWHPKFEHNRVNLDGVPKVFLTLYNSTALALLEEILYRMEHGTFYDNVFWESRGILSTPISYPIKELENVVYETPKNSNSTETILLNSKTYTRLGVGSKRKVFISPCKTYVIKIPLEPIRFGIEENLEEFRLYSENPNSFYAKCELIENNWLKMEYVEPIAMTVEDNMPEWVGSIAEGQVGYNLKGELVAYDYGSEI